MEARRLHDIFFGGFYHGLQFLFFLRLRSRLDHFPRLRGQCLLQPLLLHRLQLRLRLQHLLFLRLRQLLWLRQLLRLRQFLRLRRQYFQRQLLLLLRHQRLHLHLRLTIVARGGVMPPPYIS